MQIPQINPWFSQGFGKLTVIHEQSLPFNLNYIFHDRSVCVECKTEKMRVERESQENFPNFIY